MVESLDDRRWSSYLSVTGQESPPSWLDTDCLLNQFSSQRSDAINSYRQFVMEGKGLPSALGKTRHQLLLRDVAFAERHRQTKDSEKLREVSKAHRKSVALTLDEYHALYPNKNVAMSQA